jgi:hypothetical protein
MIQKKEGIDRRKHERFKIINAAFATVGAPSSQKCMILDISSSGLAFRHFKNTKNIKEVDANDVNKLDISVTGEDIYLSKIPFKTVYDAEIKTEMPLDKIKTRRRGIKFGRLTPQQRSQLANIIQKHTTTMAETYISKRF